MINNTFSAKRFGNYFLYDLKNASDRYLLSLIIIGLLPLVNYMFIGLFHLIFTGSWFVNTTADLLSSLIPGVITLVIAMPVKLFGGITDKKEGSNYLMLPASTLEKFASMMLIVLVVVPVIYCVLYAGSVGLLYLADSTYREAMPDMSFITGTFLNELGVDDLSFNMGFQGYLGWAQNILIFTLGAIYFKTAKPGKTILAIIVVGMFFSLLGSVAVTTFGLEGLQKFVDICATEIDYERIFNTVKIVTTTINVVWTLILMTAIYFRLKTIKH